MGGSQPLQLELEPRHKLDDLSRYTTVLAKNLKSWPRAFQVGYLDGHGYHNQSTAGKKTTVVRQHLRQAVSEGGRTLDALVLDSCRQASLENLTWMSEVSEVAVLSQLDTYSNSATNASIPRAVASSVDGREFGSRVVENSRGDLQLPTLAAFDLKKAREDLFPSLQTSGRLLLGEFLRGNGPLIQSVLKNVPQVSKQGHGYDFGAFLTQLGQLPLAHNTQKAIERSQNAFKTCRYAFQNEVGPCALSGN